MSCRICKRGGCTESFHSLSEQELLDSGEDTASEARLLRLERDAERGTVKRLQTELAALRRVADAARAVARDFRLHYTDEEHALLDALAALDDKGDPDAR